jgi:GNAT superfamily N-acetyltransferase
VSMWVAPDTRRQGVGDALVQRVIAWAEQAGFTRLELAVTVGNEAAERLYERCGFVRTEPAEWDVPTPGHETFTMRRELAKRA